MDLTEPCQSLLDLSLFFAAALVAGMVVFDERVGYVGFIAAHVLGSIIFFFFIISPIFLGQTGPQATQELANRAVVIDFRSQLPFPIFFSMIGGFLGQYFSGWLEK